MEEVVSPNNMGEINPSNKRRKETKEEVMLELKNALTKYSGFLDTLCK